MRYSLYKLRHMPYTRQIYYVLSNGHVIQYKLYLTKSDDHLIYNLHLILKYAWGKPSEEHINEQIKLSNFKFTTDTKEFTQQVVVDNFTRIVATSDIPAGTLIYSSLPLISYVYSCEQDMRILCDKFVSIPNMSFKFPNILGYVSNVGNIIELKITANTFRTRRDHMCVYNLASTFNHSCNPNCVDPIRDLDMEMRIYTIRDIKKGLLLHMILMQWLYLMLMIGEQH